MKKKNTLFVVLLTLCLVFPDVGGNMGSRVHAASFQADGAGLTEEEKATFENIIGELWWFAGLPVGEASLSGNVQVMLIRSLINEGRIQEVEDRILQSEPGCYAVSEENLRLLLDSLTAEQAPDEEYVRQTGCFTYADGLYIGPYAAGDLAVYYPVAEITGISISDGRMLLSGFLHVSYQMDYAETFYKFEAVLKENPGSVFSGYSIAALDIWGLNRDIRDITANSVLSPQFGNSYGAWNVFDQDYSTAWVEGSQGTGEGSSITFSFNMPEKVYGISVLPGYWKNRDIFYKNGYPAELDLMFSDGSHKTMSLSGGSPDYAGPEESFEYVIFDRPVETSFVTITIMDAVSGTTYEDTCITEIQLLK